MSDKIVLKCNSCGACKEIEAVCPYTGFKYGRGWTVVCTICRGDMGQIPESTVEELVAGEQTLEETII